jgi:branched-chain amino acid transport system permease protein
MGIPVGTLILVVFVIGGALAGLAGIMFEGLFPVDTNIGDNLVLYGFVVALVGGLGNPLGALLAAIPIGLIQTYLGPTSYSKWDDGFAFALVVVCLLIRPSGLLRGRAATAHD